MNGDDALMAVIRTLGAEIHRLREIIWCVQCGYDGRRGGDWYCGKCVDNMDDEVDELEGKLRDLEGEIATLGGETP